MSEDPSKTNTPAALSPAWLRHVPNALSIGRIVLTAAFVVVLSVGSSPAGESAARLTAALVIFVVAAALDGLDGFLARRWHATSVLGRILDPLADKLLTLSACVLLAGPGFADPDSGGMIGGLTPWMVTVILAREFTVTGLRSVAEGSGTAFGAQIAGKLKMIAQSVGIALLLLIAAIAAGRTVGEPGGVFAAPGPVPTGIAWVITVVTAVSAWPYIAAMLPKQKPAAGPSGDRS